MTPAQPVHTSDISLLLRAHGEQHWLVSQVIPMLRQLEHPGGVPGEQRAAALAYLEVLWLDARLRAADTDAAHAALDADVISANRVLYDRAHRYHAAVRRLRHSVGRRVAQLLTPAADCGEHQHTGS